MQKEFINPASISAPTGYTHVVATHGGRMIFISGQVAVDARGQLVGRDDLRAQTKQVYENLKSALASVGATFADVVKLNTYIVNYQSDQRAIVREVRQQYLTAEHPPASTLVGVTSLAVEGLLIEVEATAMVD